MWDPHLGLAKFDLYTSTQPVKQSTQQYGKEFFSLVVARFCLIY